MLQRKINKTVLAIIFAFGMGLPAGMASAGIYYSGHIGYGLHYGGHYGYSYGHHDDHDAHEYHGGYDHDDYEGHHHTYSPYDSDYSYPYSYGYSSYPQEIRIYSRQQNARISNSDDGNGWQLLKNNHPDEALNAFALEAQEHPDKGMPKVGYALAAAATGQLDRGVWAMRRALRFDPEALHYVVVDGVLEKRIRKILRRYEYNITSAKAADAAFMQASLHYLLRESYLAGKTIGQTALTREDTKSTRNLKQLVREKR